MNGKIILFFAAFLLFAPLYASALFQYSLQNAVVYSEREVLPSDLESMDENLRLLKLKLAGRFGMETPGKPEIRFATTLEDFRNGYLDWRIGGWYDRGKITLQPLDVLKKKGVLETILSHEYCHYYLDQAFSGMPFFLNEGLSVYLSGAFVEKSEPVLPENMAVWGETNIQDPFRLKRFLSSAREFASYLFLNGMTNTIVAEKKEILKTYSVYYDQAGKKIRVLINPRREKTRTIDFDGTCLAVEKIGDGKTDRTNFFINRIELDAADGKTFLNDHEIKETLLFFGGRFKTGLFTYRGDAKIVPANGGFLLINILPLEYYLFGTVPSEMPSTNLEALKTQAVLSRTLAVYKMKVREKDPYDLNTLTGDQSYRGTEWETAQSMLAVRETEGQVMTWENRIVYPYYSSTCGGWTALSEDVWNKELPYIKSVACRREANGGDLCSVSPHYREWKRTLAADELAGILRSGPITNLETFGTDSHGRIKAVIVNGTEIPFDAFKAKIAAKKGWNFLKSNLVTIDQSKDGKSFEITGRGLGHGVGLCQYGAVRLSEKSDYRQIIRFYFKDVTVRELGDEPVYPSEE